MSIVAISQRVDYIAERSETRDSLDQRLAQFVGSVGSHPVPVPNVLGESLLDWLSLLRPTAIVLSGGNDIGEYPDRDQTECVLLKYAHDKKLPTLGICRGMQMMANWVGVGVKPVRNHVAVQHEVFGDINRNVRSFHTLSLVDCPPGYEVTAWSHDGQIEAIRHREMPWEGWMWHPERESRYDEQDLIRFAKILRR